MKKTPTTKPRKTQEMASEYRFAARMKDEPLIVMIEPDIAKVFTSAEQVNKALRALISAKPEKEMTTGKY